MVIVSCGKCCSEEHLCDRCIISTLKANGLSVYLFKELEVLKQKNSSYSGIYSTKYSEIGYKLIELLK